MAALEPCDTDSFFKEMQVALEGAEGLREDWLMEYARRAEECNISKQTLTDFLLKT